MYTLLLALIYLAFISLGLPDSILGSAWPVMREDLNAPLPYAGVISMVIAMGTIVSSLLSDRMKRLAGTGLVTAISVFVTAIALYGFSVSSSVWMLMVFSVPYGLGAGAVDAALNNFVALHYKSRHMNWLHSFWGVGAAAGPLIMGFCLANGYGWHGGYKMIAVIQVVLAVTLFIALPLWGGIEAQSDTLSEPQKKEPLKLQQIMRIKGIKCVLAAFFCYCALEWTVALWASSYLVIQRGIDAETAARYASFFFFGITGGRFLCGFVSDKVGDRNMIRIGICVILTGIVAVFIPSSAGNWVCLNGLIIIGLGCAPVYPSVIHATPANFGRENSQAVIGVQMAAAYIGTTFMPPVFGFIANNTAPGIGLYPVFLLILALLMLVMTEKLNLTLAI